MGKFQLKSLEQVSITRKISALFILIAVFPFAAQVIFFFYVQHKIELNSDHLLLMALFSGVFILIGFFGIRQVLSHLLQIYQIAKKVPKGIGNEQGIEQATDNEIAQIARSFNDVVSKLETTIKELEKSRGTLQDVLIKTARGVSFSENLNAFLELILQTTVTALSAQGGVLLLLDETTKKFTIKTSYGLENSQLIRLGQIPFESDVDNWILVQRRPLLIPRLQRTTIPSQSSDPALELPFICVPLIFQNAIIGALAINNREREGSFSEEEMIILSNISAQVALAIMNAKLNADTQKSYLETITALALAVEARDMYSRGHSDRVGDYAVKIAAQLGLGDEKIKIVKDAAQLHDVGKIGISDDILKKPAELNGYEWEIMRQHPVIGEGIIIPLRGFSVLRDPIRHHHEWLNGEGYPDHLRGDAISIEAKILAVADSFDAMTTDRPYRKAMSHQQAKEELLRCQGTRYDHSIVEALIRALAL